MSVDIVKALGDYAPAPRFYLGLLLAALLFGQVRYQMMSDDIAGAACAICFGRSGGR